MFFSSKKSHCLFFVVFFLNAFSAQPLFAKSLIKVNSATVFACPNLNAEFVPSLWGRDGKVSRLSWANTGHMWGQLYHCCLRWLHPGLNVESSFLHCLPGNMHQHAVKGKAVCVILDETTYTMWSLWPVGKPPLTVGLVFLERVNFTTVSQVVII